jgi:hypothetical protein
MVIKLDMENTFDHVCHSFLFQVMDRFGFNSSFIQWVVSCIGNPWIAPQVNGRPIGWFQAIKGLHQGHPLSPLIFIIVVEYLIRKLERGREIGNLPGLKISRGIKNTNHSQFIDENLYIGGSSTIIYSCFKSLLDSFIDASGGVVNERKIQVFGWHISPRIIHSIAQIFHFPLAENWTSLKYLGRHTYHSQVFLHRFFNKLWIK